MDTIIQDFAENVNGLVEEKLKEILLKQDEDIDYLVDGLKDELDKLGRELCQYVIEELDEVIKESDGRKESWVVERSNDEKTILTRFGAVSYERTYYKSKGDQGYSHLVDRKLGISAHQRTTSSLESTLVELAADNSYSKSGEMAVNSLQLSDQTVMNKLRKIEEVKKEVEQEEKREVKYLYVEADEDHVALQNGGRCIPKLVYVHEGKEKQGKKTKLKNRYCFSGIYDESDNLWLEVLDYIDENYTVDKIETIFLAGDGATWIKKGLEWLPKAKYVLDRYHLNKYVLRATGHAEELRSKLWFGLNQCNREKVKDVLSKAWHQAEKESKKKSVEEARTYIYKNWEGIKNYVKEEKVLGCSAESHVSHILADRLSSRPLAWSEEGIDKMAQLRAFRHNGGKKKELKTLLKEKEAGKRHKEKLAEISAQKVNSQLKRKFAEPKKNVPSINYGKKTGIFRVFKSII